MLRIKNNKKILHILMYTLITILPPTATGGICEYINNVSNVQSTYSALYTLGNNITARIIATADAIDYCMKLLAHGNDFHALDTAQINKQIDLARYYNPKLYNNVVVIDKNHNFIYGVCNENFKQLNCVQQSLSTGKIFYNYELIDETPILKVCYPILKDNNTNTETVGVIICDLNMDYIEPILSDINVFGDNIEAYLVDSDGVLISNSRNVQNTRGVIRMDIDKIKLAIDYNPYKSFKNYRDKNTYGVYFDIPNLNWTLVVTDNIPQNSQNVMNTIGYVSAFSGASGLGIIELIKKMSANKRLTLSLLEDVNDSNKDDAPKSGV